MSVTVTIDAADFGGHPDPDDYVILSAPAFRESVDRAGGVVTTAPRRIPLTEGKATVEVEPGPLLVEFHCRNIRDSAAKEITVPIGGGPLSQLMQATFEYDPPVLDKLSQGVQEAMNHLSQLTQLTTRAETAADSAKKSDDSVTEKITDVVANAADKIRDQVKADADTATTKAAEATNAATSAEASKNAADTSAQQASTARNGAVTARNQANTAANTAKTHADTATAKATEATNAATTAEQAKNAATASATSAEESKNAAATSATNAAESEANAQKYARQAASGAPAGGWTKQSLAAAVQSSLDKADTASQPGHKHATADIDGLDEAIAAGSTDATPTTKGKIQLAGDLAGTADAPTVPALAGKLNAADVEAAGVTPQARKVPRRAANGNITVPQNPNAASYATSKAYVDTRTPRIQVVASMPASPAQGVVYLVTG